MISADTTGYGFPPKLFGEINILKHITIACWDCRSVIQDFGLFENPGTGKVYEKYSFDCPHCLAPNEVLSKDF